MPNNVSENKKKVRIALWLYPEEVQMLDKMVSDYAHPSRNQFISAAIQFYGGYLRSTEKNNFLPLAIETSLQGIVNSSEDRIARLLFKLTVELSMVMNVLASTCEIDEGILGKLRSKCIQDVKRTVGKINFEEVAAYQNRSEN